MIQIGHKTRRASNMPHDISILTLPLPLRMGRVNCYLIRTADGHVLIDTGGSTAGRLAQRTRKRRLHAGFTHAHDSHAWGLRPYRERGLSSHNLRASIAMHTDDAGMAERGDMFVNRKRPNLLVRSLVPLFTGFGGPSGSRPTFPWQMETTWLSTDLRPRSFRSRGIPEDRSAS